MSDLYKLIGLTLSGFRAYLAPRSFDFRKKQSLAIFAPNGKGKSSLVDGLEFIFSDDGTLKRLGIRTTQNQAGHLALAHNMAQDSGIESFVEISVALGKQLETGKRLATGQERSRPSIATAMRDAFVVSPIIRGHELRRFVEERTAEGRYEDVAGWLDLGPLVAVQQNLRELRRKTKAAAESKDALKQIDSQLAKKTGNLLKAWDDAALVEHINTLIAELDASLAAKSIDLTDPALLAVADRAKAEAEQLGLASLRHIRSATIALIGERQPGLITDFAAAVASRDGADAVAEREKKTAANAVFEEIWRIAEPLFAEGAATPEACPICDTPLAETKAGSAKAISMHLARHRGELGAYAAARKAADTAKAALQAKQDGLLTGLRTLSSLLPEERASTKELLASYSAKVEAWESGAVPESAAIVADLLASVGDLNAAIDQIVSKQGESTYSKANAKIADLIELADERARTQRELSELENLNAALNLQSKQISTEIRKKVQAVLDTLQKPMNDIYAKIQRNAAIPVRFELPDEEDTAQQRLGLVVDFAANRAGVPPSGYLSDSQIHSLALALRLAAIRRCNPRVPLIILDDIVTSYDADHRLAFTSLLAQEFAEFQVILVTHDERFFAFLKDHLGDQHWQYKRILQLTADGPRLSDDRVSDELIEERWTEGKSAANDMRQAEEEWLLAICRDFGVDVKIRTVERAYSYERSELAEALGRFLGSRGLTPPVVPGVNNRFLTSLQKGDVENFGSHFQDAQYGAGSIGDEKVRWEEFKFFRDAFVCGKCKKSRFKRPTGLTRPVCTTEKCETQFAFAVPGATNAVA
ncbi:chromosome segregation protein SMC [Mesorhizobium opportunistum]|uniref:AAA family ATPase n=1 Tax=Mesorhizobium opportunistum TaxID=593909 RepID=UPI00333DD5BF